MTMGRANTSTVRKRSDEINTLEQESEQVKSCVPVSSSQPNHLPRKGRDIRVTAEEHRLAS